LASLQTQLATLQNQEKAARAETAKAKSDAQAEQAQAKEYFHSIEQKHQLVAAEYQELKVQAAKLREALALASKQPAAAPAAAPRSPAPVQATQLPVLEEQIIALQSLEKTIKKEFQLLAELQRNVTLTTTTRHEFNDSPESRAGAPA
jgi:chromosome segregation ATPase